MELVVAVQSLANNARCIGCGATYAFCEKLRKQNTDLSAPPWMGCCAMGTNMCVSTHRHCRGMIQGIINGTR